MKGIGFDPIVYVDNDGLKFLKMILEIGD